MFKLFFKQRYKCAARSRIFAGIIVMTTQVLPTPTADVTSVEPDVRTLFLEELPIKEMQACGNMFVM